MNYLPQLFQSMLLMLIYSHFGFSMKGQPPRKSGLNPNAKPFHPQRQINPNSPQSEPPTSQFNSNVAHHQFQSSHFHRSSQQIAEDPIKLPDFLFPWEEKEQILSNQDAQFIPPEMGSSSQDALLTPPEIGEADGSQGTDAFNQKLTDENPSGTEHSKIDPIHKEKFKSHLKQGTAADIQLADKKVIDQSIKSIGQKQDVSNFISNLMIPRESKSPSSSKSEKEKQQHSQQQLQTSNRGVKNNRQSGSGSTLPSKGISPRILEKTPEHGAPDMNSSKKDEINILDRASIAKESSSNPIPNPQEQNKLEEEEDKANDEHKDQRNQQQQSRKSVKSKKKGKDKQKAVISQKEIESMKIKEKEENELLDKLLEDRKKEIQKQKLEEEHLKMKEKNEEKQRGKQKMDNVFPSNNMSLKKEIVGKQLNHPVLSATPPINPTMASGSSGYGGGGGEEENNEQASNSALAAIKEQSLSFLIKNEIERKEKLEKYNKIKKFLTKLEKKLDEIEKLEHIWLMERIKQFPEEDKNRNPNEKEEDIKQIRIEILKLSDTEESIRKEKENIVELTEKRKELTSLSDINYANLNNSINKKKKKIRNKDKIAIAKFRKVEDELEEIIFQLSEKENNEKNLQKQIDELQKSLLYKFTQLNNNLKPETGKIKEIQKQMEEPLKHLWIGYDVVHKILDQHWKTPKMKEEYYDRQPFDYNFISIIFAGIAKNNAADAKAELSTFENTMKLTLEKILLHQNIYRSMNFKTIVNGESISVYEKLNCFDELWNKMKIFVEERNEIEIELPKNKDENIKLEFEHMKRMGKYFKNELNHKFREVLSFIMVGLDELPDVWDQMVLNGIKELSEWLPKNRKRQMDKIWMLLFSYYWWEENSNVQFLSKSVNDKEAENVFDFSPDDEYFEERIGKLLPIINGLHECINSFSTEIKDFMTEAFGHIKAFIQSIKMLLKIEKREEDAKPLPYLKSVYEKYWYMILKDRFDHHFEHVREYEFGREINQIEREKRIKELLAKAPMKKDPKVKEIFQQIALIDPGILAELMKIIDMLDEFLTEIKIKDRVDKYENDPDLMNSISKNNPNINHYNSLWVEFYGNDDK